MRKSINNGNISWLDEGEGATVVLLHGFSENACLWNAQAKALKNQYRIIIPDLPGTSAVPIHTPLTIETMAEYVYTILLAENITGAVVIGHSMGGYIALALAEKYPHLLKGLGLFHSTARADSEEKKEGRLKSIKLMEQYGGSTFLKQTLPDMFSPIVKSNHPELINSYVNMGLECQLPALPAYYSAMLDRPDRTAVLKNASIPVLFVIGKEDQAVPMDNILPQITLPAISSIYILEQVGHVGMWEAEAASNKILQQFSSFCQR